MSFNLPVLTYESASIEGISKIFFWKIYQGETIKFAKLLLADKSVHWYLKSFYWPQIGEAQCYLALPKLNYFQETLFLGILKITLTFAEIWALIYLKHVFKLKLYYASRQPNSKLLGLLLLQV